MTAFEYDHALRLEALREAVHAKDNTEYDVADHAREFYDFLTDKQPEKPKGTRALAEEAQKASQALLDHMDEFKYGGLLSGLNKKQS